MGRPRVAASAAASGPSLPACPRGGASGSACAASAIPATYVFVELGVFVLLGECLFSPPPHLVLSARPQLGQVHDLDPCGGLF